jgi:septum formation protein
MLTDYHIVLASNSPRRKELLAGLDIDFEVRLKKGIDEKYPQSLPVMEVAEYISGVKADAYLPTLRENELLITADTVVIVDNEIFGKPVDKEDANRMLKTLSGRTHSVVTGVCMQTKQRRNSFSVRSDVTFAQLTDEEINYYVNTYQPFDKAGAYGIQEWIGLVGVTCIKGSYFNVMGLPVQRICAELKNFK